MLIPDIGTTPRNSKEPRPTLSPGGTAAELTRTLLRLGDRLGAPGLAVAVVAIGDIAVELSPGEQAQFRRLRAPARRRSWLAGRVALRTVRRRLGLQTDTSTLRFPDPCTSLTHAAGYAISVAVPRGMLAGLGVDLEARRETSPQTARFFLTDSERAWLERRPADCRSAERVRLWTVKEAVYKAWADNRGLSLSRIELDDPSAEMGAVADIPHPAYRAKSANAISYASNWTSAGCVSLAVLPVRHCQDASIAGYSMGRKQ